MVFTSIRIGSVNFCGVDPWIFYDRRQERIAVWNMFYAGACLCYCAIGAFILKSFVL